MTNLTHSYSGVVINQNQRPLAGDFLPAAYFWYYQDFVLPENYTRGTTDSEKDIPELSGIQIMVGVDSGYSETASLDWVLQYNLFSNGWIDLAEGTTIGSHAEGDKVWFDIEFDEPVKISPTILGQRLRFGVRARGVENGIVNMPVTYDGATVNIDGDVQTVTVAPGIPHPVTHNGVPGFLLYSLTEQAVRYSEQQGVLKFWYSSPNPYSTIFCKAYSDDGVTAINDGGDVSLCFRILGLVADSGTDFLGNNYRSAVVISSVNDTSRLTGDKNASWLSKPNPSRFAIESLYYDVRPQQKTRSYGLMNLILDPGFEGSGSTWAFTLGGSSTGVIDTGWFDRGAHSAKLTIPTGQTSSINAIGSDVIGPTTGFQVQSGQTLALGVTVNITTSNSGCSVFSRIKYYDSTGTFISNSDGASINTVGVSRPTVVSTIPPNAELAVPYIVGVAVGGTLTFYSDSAFLGTI